MKRKLFALIALTIVLLISALPIYATTDSATEEPATHQIIEEDVESETQLLGDKSMASGLAIGIAAGLGALGMGVAVGKSVEGISRQPEAEGKIRTTLMLGLVFIETAIIYALLTVILIIFVL
ncbi:MAG: ATP synthase F0 subunit C [Firmicutes bacterium]|nr:ATP synthase F0 subunit C [Bacillota bacterium]